MSIAKRMREAVDSVKQTQGLSIKEICDKIGITQQGLAYLVKNDGTPSFDKVRLLEKHYNVNYDYVIHGTGDIFKPNEIEANHIESMLKHLAEIELFESPAYANTGTVLPLDDYVVGSRKIAFKHPISDPDNFGILRVYGSSMVREGILEGDYVVFKKQTFAKNNQIVVIRLNGQLLVKIYKENNGIEFHSNDGSTEPIVKSTDDNCEIVGIVINVIRDI